MEFEEFTNKAQAFAPLLHVPARSTTGQDQGRVLLWSRAGSKGWGRSGGEQCLAEMAEEAAKESPRTVMLL